jgi:hypothetical protein
VLVFQANENIIIQSASESYLMRSFFKVWSNNIKPIGSNLK